MQIEPNDYLQKLIEIYQAQCNQYLNERISLQAQLDLVLKELEKTETKLAELENKEEKVTNVNSNIDT